MKKNNNQIFSPRTVMVLVGLALFAMITSLLVVSFSNEQETYSTVRPNSFSVSAIGHKAFVDSLKLQNSSVVISQYRTKDRLAYDSILMLLEPNTNFSKPELLKKLLDYRAVMLVLPKRFGARRDMKNIRWIGRAGTYSHDVPEKIIQMIDPKAEIYRPYDPKKTKEDIEKEKAAAKEQKAQKKPVKKEKKPEMIEKPLNWTINEYGNESGYQPDLLNPQLIKSDEITPLLATDDGILIGTYLQDEQIKLIIADPDLLSNFGLGRGDNAKIIFEALTYFTKNNGTIFIDETSHGFTRNPDIIRAAFQYPFIFITMQLLVFVILLIWATAQRFGTPYKARKALKPGKAVLIQNSVDLLEVGNHKPEILMRYVELTLQAMARKLGVPRHLNERAVIGWLDEYGERRGITVQIKTIKHRALMLSQRGLRQTNSFMDVVHEKPLMQIALHLEKWKQEMLDGSGSDKINQ